MEHEVTMRRTAVIINLTIFLIHALLLTNSPDKFINRVILQPWTWPNYNA